jgi:hypothetical protein
MHRSQKLLGDGGQEYFNEKRLVNLRVGRRAQVAEFSLCRGILRKSGSHRDSVLVAGDSAFIHKRHHWKLAHFHFPHVGNLCFSG